MPKIDRVKLPKGNKVRQECDQGNEVPVLPVQAKAIAPTTKAKGPNPKDVLGNARPSMTKFPAVALVHAVDAMMDGAGKYDPYNWRAKDITARNYADAAIRHVLMWMEGEDRASDSGAKHLGHAIAGLGILLDAEAHGCLIDDRLNKDQGEAFAAALEFVKANERARAIKRSVTLQDGLLRHMVNNDLTTCKGKCLVKRAP